MLLGFECPLRFRTAIFLRFERIFFFTLASCAVVSGQNTGGKSSNPEVLQPASAITRQILGRQVHSYQLDLPADQAATVSVDQVGVDLTVRVKGVDGKVIADVDSEHTGDGKETIALVSESIGRLTIEISAVSPFAKEGRYSIVVITAGPAAAKDRELFKATKQYYEALRLLDSSMAENALDAAKISTDIRERLLGPDSIDLAYSLMTTGLAYSALNDQANAERLLTRALSIFEKAPGKDSYEYSDALISSGRAAFLRGDLKAAEQLNIEALLLREKLFGPDSLPVATSLQNLGIIYRAMNDLPNAEKSNLRALKIRERLLGNDHIKTADILNNLGLMYYGAADYVNAEKTLLRSLAIKEKGYGPNHRLVGTALNNLGLVEWKKNDYEKAEAYWQRALKIFEEVGGPDSEGVSGILGNLGIIYKEHFNDYSKAEEYQERSLAIIVKRQGEYSVGTAIAVSSLGLIYRAIGDYARAETYFLRALKIYEKVVGSNHHNTVLVLSALARTYAATGNIKSSLEYLKRIEAIEGATIPLNLTVGSERQKMAFFSQLQNPDRDITFLVNLAPENTEARDLVLNQILQRKGRVLDALSQGLFEFGRRAGPEERQLLDKLNTANSDISKFMIDGAGKLTPEEFERQMSERLSLRDGLEADINRRSSGFYEPSKPITIDSVRPFIPDDAALVEFAIYYPFDWKSEDAGNPYRDPRYIVFVLRKGGEIRWRELGPARDIDDAIGAMRVAFRDPKRTDAAALSRIVDEKVMRPVREMTGSATHLMISPDGDLNVIPFEALVDENSHYLVERLSFTYLSSGRDLLRMAVERSSMGPPMIFADPAFGEPVQNKVAADNTGRRLAGKYSRRRSVTAARDFSDTYFAPLSGTDKEALSIKMIFPDASIYTGQSASESTLKQVSAPRILHIATHGFFIGKPKSNDEDAESESKNPLLLSGLALAGANRRSGDEDGVLTALEASGLNLWGTKLVVLSACDSGLGEIRVGEGVYGLRRSFMLAGAESVVMSLWPVSDYVTRELMAGYYRNLKQGLGRGEALRQIQLEMLKRSDRRHPFFWAAFIQAGEWANLDGKR